MSITGILMLGLSIFFSSTFHNLFQAQNQATNTEKQFAITEIIRDKFSTLSGLIEGGNNGDSHVLTFNKNTKNQLPFSFIGVTQVNAQNRLAFKDMMIFNKVYRIGAGNYIYGDSGTGNIKEMNGTPVAGATTIPKNFGGFVKIGTEFYVTIPNENRIDCFGTDCTAFDFNNELLLPTDIARDTNGNYLFISDSENGRIIKYTLATADEEIIISGLNYPTGLAFYDDGTANGALFVADTFNNQIKKINLNNSDEVSIVVGNGNDTTCDNSALFCKLNLPTGLYMDNDNDELYIADSGNNRILKMSEPASSDLTNFTIEFSLESQTQIGKIKFIFPENSIIDVSASTSNDLHTGKFTAIDEIGDANNETLNYELSAAMNAESYKETECNCDEDSDPVVCQTCFNAFSVVADDNIFETNDDILINMVNYGITDPSTDNKILVDVNDTEDLFAPGTIVKIINEFTEDPVNPPYEFEFDLTSSTLDPTGFQNVQVEIYNGNNDLIQEETYLMRVGDGELGTIEDVIEVIAGQKPDPDNRFFITDASGTDHFLSNDIIFPTGVNDQYFANSGNELIVEQDGTETAFDAVDAQPANFNSFDYTSDFALDDTNPIEFNKYNADKILEVEITVPVEQITGDTTQTYKINATLP